MSAMSNPLSSQSQSINQPTQSPVQSQAAQSINQSLSQLSINPPISKTNQPITKPINNFTPLDKPLPLAKSSKEVPLVTFVYLFNELINQSIKKSDRIVEIEKKLNEYGQFVGSRMVDLSYVQSTNQSVVHPSLTRPRSVLSLLQHIHLHLWKSLFQRPSDGLEKSTETASEFYLYDNTPVTNKYLSLPKEYAELNCASFQCGIIEGFAQKAGFDCEVAAHFNATPEKPGRSVYIIKFTDAVMKRESMTAH